MLVHPLALVVHPRLHFLIFKGLDLGIDFTGGTIWEIQFDQTVDTEQIKSVLAAIRRRRLDRPDVVRRWRTDNVAIIRMEELATPPNSRRSSPRALTNEIGPFTELQISTVGSSVSNQWQRGRFSPLPSLRSASCRTSRLHSEIPTPAALWRGAIIGMLHDVLLVLGVFSILGRLFDVQVDALFVTAILTVIGFSVHDTIVVFDRIRENLARQTDPTSKASSTTAWHRPSCVRSIPR